MASSQTALSLSLLALAALCSAPAIVLAQTYGYVPAERARAADPETVRRFSSEGLSEIQLPGGGVAVNLEGRFRHYLVAHSGPDGKLHVGCTMDPAIPHEHEGSATGAGE